MPLAAVGLLRPSPGAFLVSFCAHKKKLAVRRNLTGPGGQECPLVAARATALAHHLSAPFSLGSTCLSASMPTSIMESSGSKVVKFCIHMPGARSARHSQPS